MLPGKRLIQLPDIRDRIPKEHYPLLSGCRRPQLHIVIVIPRELAEVIHQHPRIPFAIQFQTPRRGITVLRRPLQRRPCRLTTLRLGSNTRQHHSHQQSQFFHANTLPLRLETLPASVTIVIFPD